MDLCDICSEKTMILIPEKGTDRLIDHITKVHLPVYCRKCLQVFTIIYIYDIHVNKHVFLRFY